MSLVTKGIKNIRVQDGQVEDFILCHFSILNRPPRTPAWEIMLLLFSGTIIIFGDDTETVSITDENGMDLNAQGERATALLKDGKVPEEFFVGYNGFDRSPSAPNNQILIRREGGFYEGQEPGQNVEANSTIFEVIKNRRFSNFNSLLSQNQEVKNLIGNRTANHILNDQHLRGKLPPNLAKELENIVNTNRSRNFTHKVKAKKDGKLEYVINHKLTQIKIEADVRINEVQDFIIRDIGTNAAILKIRPQRDTKYKLHIHNKIGGAGDYLNLELLDVPVSHINNLEINIKSGLSGVEILNKNINASIKTKINAQIDGKTINKTFNVPFNETIRIKPSLVLGNNELLVSNIERIFGKVISSQRIQN